MIGVRADDVVELVADAAHAAFAEAVDQHQVLEARAELPVAGARDDGVDSARVAQHHLVAVVVPGRDGDLPLDDVGIVAGAAVHGVDVGIVRGMARVVAAEERVVAGAADHRVGAGAAVEDVVAGEAFQRVVAQAAGQRVVT